MDDPIRGHVLRDTPASVGAIGALHGFDVLAGDQRQQRHRVSSLGAEFGLGEMAQHSVHVADQGIDELLAGGLSFQAIFGLPGSS